MLRFLSAFLIFSVNSLPLQSVQYCNFPNIQYKNLIQRAAAVRLSLVSVFHEQLLSDINKRNAVLVN